MKRLIIVIAAVASLLWVGHCAAFIPFGGLVLKALREQIHGPVPSKRSAYHTLRNGACDKEILEYRKIRATRSAIKWYDDPMFNPPHGEPRLTRYSHAMWQLSACLRAAHWYEKWNHAPYTPRVSPLCIKAPRGCFITSDPNCKANFKAKIERDPFYCK